MATIYVYPTNQEQSDSSELLVAEFERVKREILEVDSNARITEESDRKFGFVHPTKVARFRTERELVTDYGPEPVVSDLALLVAGDCFVKYRFSYPAWQLDDVGPEIQMLVTSIGFPTPRE